MGIKSIFDRQSETIFPPSEKEPSVKPVDFTKIKNSSRSAFQTFLDRACPTMLVPPPQSIGRVHLLDEVGQKPRPLDFQSDYDLRLLIGSPENLIKNGIGKSYFEESFFCKKMGWTITGKSLGVAVFGSLGIGRKEAEALALRLWPKEAKELLIDFKNPEHLRLLANNSDIFVKDGQAISLYGISFSCPEKKWKVSGAIVGKEVFGDVVLTKYHTILLLCMLHPHQALKRLSILQSIKTVLGDVNQFLKKDKWGQKIIPISQIEDFSLFEPESQKIFTFHHLIRLLSREKTVSQTAFVRCLEILYPEIATFIFCPESDDHLRALKPLSKLIQNGKYTELRDQVFECPERGWKFTGNQMGRMLFNVESPGLKESETFARRIDPQYTKEHVFDIKNPEHLRSLIKSPKHLQQENGDWKELRDVQIPLPETDRMISGKSIEFALFGTTHFTKDATKKVVFFLWPEYIEQPRFDIKNSEQLRAFFKSPLALLHNGKGVNLDIVKFEPLEYPFKISGQSIGSAWFPGKRVGSEDAEILARILWGEEVEKYFLDLHNLEHLKLLIKEQNQLLHNGKLRALQFLTFSYSERGWNVSGRIIGRILFKNENAGVTGTMQLAQMIFGDDFKRDLEKQSEKTLLLPRQADLKTPPHFQAQESDIEGKV